MRKPGRRKPSVPKRSLIVERILVWADDFHTREDRWPKSTDELLAGGSAGIAWRRHACRAPVPPVRLGRAGTTPNRGPRIISSDAPEDPGMGAATPRTNGPLAGSEVGGGRGRAGGDVEGHRPGDAGGAARPAGGRVAGVAVAADGGRTGEAGAEAESLTALRPRPLQRKGASSRRRGPFPREVKAAACNLDISVLYYPLRP